MLLKLYAYMYAHKAYSEVGVHSSIKFDRIQEIGPKVGVGALSRDLLLYKIFVKLFQVFKMKISAQLDRVAINVELQLWNY